MNHKTWSRDGHKCMTGKVSADPGRPCVFPFYATTDNNGSLEWNCIVPDTYNKDIMNMIHEHKLQLITTIYLQEEVLVPDSLRPGHFLGTDWPGEMSS